MIDINKIHLIAEIGINHNGDIDIAKKLIDNAKESNFHSIVYDRIVPLEFLRCEKSLQRDS